jgi:hypothetical protein
MDAKNPHSHRQEQPKYRNIPNFLMKSQYLPEGRYLPKEPLNPAQQASFGKKTEGDDEEPEVKPRPRNNSDSWLKNEVGNNLEVVGEPDVRPVSLDYEKFKAKKFGGWEEKNRKQGTSSPDRDDAEMIK